MKTVLSGIRPTGKLHLGNYYGAIMHFLKMQKGNNCYFFIADWHSLTTNPKPDQLHVNVSNIISEYIACGLDPNKTAIYRQSDIPEIAQLYLLLNMLAPIGELQRTASFKEHIEQHSNNANAGLFTYPVLMAADVLIVHADFIPIGKDQEQHLEMICHYVRKFNRLYGNYFKEPITSCAKKLIKIPGLDGNKKMGKSEKNCIYLTDHPKIIEKKIQNALTDNGPIGINSHKPDCIKNLFTIFKMVSSNEEVNYYENLWKIGAQKWYEKLKKQLSENIIQITNPIRQRVMDIQLQKEYLRKTMKDGAEKTRETAQKTLREVRSLMGFKSL